MQYFVHCRVVCTSYAALDIKDYQQSSPCTHRSTSRRLTDTTALDEPSPAMLQAKLAHTQQELQRLQTRLQQMQGQRAAAEQRLASVAAPLTTPTPTPLTAPNATPLTASPMPTTEAGNGALDISGVWIKDEQLSDLRTITHAPLCNKTVFHVHQFSLSHTTPATGAYSDALDLMQLNTLQKHAALRLFEGVEITQDASGFSVRFLTVVPFFKVTESFSFGHDAAMGRRDLKAGQQVAHTVVTPQRVQVAITWPNPNAGNVLEVYTCPEPNVLHLLSRVTVGGRMAETLQVYRRQDTWVPQNTWGH